MKYIFEFDIASVLINAILIIFFFVRKNIPTKQNKIFYMILISQTVTSVLDLYLTLQIMYNLPASRALLWFLNCISYTSINIFGLLFSKYCLAIVGYAEIESKKNVKIVRYIISIPLFIILAVIWLSPVVYELTGFPLVFYIDAGKNYFRGGNLFYSLLYFFCTYYVVFSFIILICYRKRISSLKIILLFAYVFVVYSTVLIQLFIPELLVQCFGITLASLVFYFYVQRPEEVFDSVTDCFNQSAFVSLIPQQISKTGNVSCVSIILDDTYFLANTFGISRLDDFMREISLFLYANFKEHDIYHLSQGCFCVVLEDPKNDDIERVVGIIQNRFNKVWVYDSITIKLYSRICIVNCPEQAVKPEEIIDIINLVTTDDRYKQAIVNAENIDLEYKRRTRYIDHAVRQGLTENRMDVYYQPIWSTKEKRLIGAEALVRLKDSQGNFISPEDFIPIAEKNGAILRIGEYVFESVCRTLSSIDYASYGIKKVDINLSVAQCMQEILAEQIMTIRSMYNIPSSLINLEITETAAAHTPEILLRNMQNLTNAGFELSLDDYGSGYSNMNYMLNLPFKMIKIDKYIVWSAYEDKRANTALSATVSMIKKLGMTVLAEGVEKEEQVKWLSKLGCDYLQGYYYSKPVPKDEFLKLMREDVMRYQKENKIVPEEDDSIEVIDE